MAGSNSILNKQLDILEASFREGIDPPPDFTIGEWSDKKRILPSESTSEHGLWRNSRTPYLVEIMFELSPASRAETVIFMKGSQVGATEVGINFLLYIIEHNPAPTLHIQPTVDLARRFSKQRLTPSINAIPEIARKVIENKSRGKGNTTLQKDFPGGTLMLTGANSAVGLRSMPAKNLFGDEIDGYPQDADGEGDPLDLAIRRTTNFSDAKKFFASTPTVDEFSRIQKLFAESDQRYYYVPCPFCGEFQVITWKHLKFDNHDPETVRMICEFCSGAIYEHNKTKMLADGYWKAHNPDSKIPGFHISALYSPLGWFSWVDVVDQHLKAIGEPKKRQVWVNTVLGEVWADNTSTIDTHFLANRREKYVKDIPANALVLTCGVDVQDDRLEYSIYGWGLQHESWLIKHHILRGDPGQQDVWDLLDIALQADLQHELYGSMKIACTCIDSMGHHTDEVYAFCKTRYFRRIFAIRGRGGQGLPVIAKVTKLKDKKLYLFNLGVDQAKETIYARLRLRKAGPGFVHFPDTVGDIFFAQLTAEKRVLKHTHGLPKLQWTLSPGKRNEALDCAVYALAGLQILDPNMDALAEQKKVYRGIQTKKAPPRRGTLSKGVS